MGLSFVWHCCRLQQSFWYILKTLCFVVNRHIEIKSQKSCIGCKCSPQHTEQIHTRGKELYSICPCIFFRFLCFRMVDYFSLKLDSTESIFLLWHSSIAFYKYISSHGSLYLKALLNSSLRHKLSIGTQYCHRSLPSFHYSSL